jgi:F420-non-reducing hydrogenase iron-sulfur subunit
VKAEKMFDMTRDLVQILGINPARLRLEWISSAEGTRFAEVASEFTEQVRSLGPSKLKSNRQRPAA